MQRILKILLILIFFSPIPGISASLNSEPTKEFTLSLAKLTTLPTINLTGRSPSYSFFLPQPKQWKINLLLLKLTITRSPAIRDDSSLTVYVNDTPIQTIVLNKQNQENYDLTVKIPGNLLTESATPIRISGYLKTNEQRCQDDKNEGSWIRVDGQSTITYDYQTTNYNSMLAAYPYPFINSNGLTADQVTILIPGNDPQVRFASAFRFANTLAQNANWRGLDLKLLTSVSDPGSAVQDENIVLIGKGENLAKILSPYPKFFQEKIKQPLEALKSTPKAGLLTLTPSPWNPYHALLIITGNTNFGIEKAVMSLSRKDIITKLSEMQSLPIFKLPPQEMQQHFQDIETFKSLNYSDQTVTGTGDHVLQYRFTLPPDKKADKLSLVLTYNYSPYISKDIPSYLFVKINNQQVTGKELKPHNSDLHILTVDIPSRLVTSGVNQLSIGFLLNLPNPICSDKISNKAWAKVLDTSELILKQKDKEESPNLAFLSDYYTDKNTIVSLPGNPLYYNNTKFEQSLINFSQALPQLNNLLITSNRFTTRAMLKTNSLIYIGLTNNNKNLLAYLQTKLSKLNNDLVLSKEEPLTIDQINNFDIIKGGKKVKGLILLDDASHKIKKPVLLIVSNNLSGLTDTVSLLSDPTKKSTLKNNLVLLFDDNTFTSISFEEKERLAKRQSIYNKIGKISFIALIVTISIFIFALIFFSYKVSMKVSEYKKNMKK